MKRLLLLSALLVICANGATAADSDKQNEFAVIVGGYATGSKVQIQGEGDVGKGGPSFGFRYLRNIDSKIALGVEADVFNPGSAESTSLVTGGISSVKVQTTEILMVGRARFGKERIHPFALAGFGLHSTSMQIDVKPQAGFVWLDTGTREPRTAVDDRKAGLALSLQGGVDVDLSETLVLGGNLGWHYQAESTYEATPAGKAGGLLAVKGALSGVNVGLNLAFRF